MTRTRARARDRTGGGARGAGAMDVISVGRKKFTPKKFSPLNLGLTLPRTGDSVSIMKIIIAGGRNYRFKIGDRSKLANIPDVTEVVSGGAPGADAAGESWARANNIPVKRFPADWGRHGKAAGPIRNRQMAEYADAVALFPGGRGTESMRREAERAGLQIFDFTGVPPIDVD